MLAAFDVQYDGDVAFAVGITFETWGISEHSASYILASTSTMEYTPGEFYKRELPCLLDLLEWMSIWGPVLEAIVIDCNVYLDEEETIPGLGKRLYDALETPCPVIGVAKNKYKGLGLANELYRPSSNKPLYVTSVGMSLDTAKGNILNMAGLYRMPTLLKKVDTLCRERAKKGYST